jgi:hypothetical protein
VLCKVKHKAHYKTVAETVVVEPAYTRGIVVPAQYEYVQEPVLIQPEQRRVIDSPATYETVARQVVVSEGTSGWKRVHIARHCD